MLKTRSFNSFIEYNLIWITKYSENVHFIFGAFKYTHWYIKSANSCQSDAQNKVHSAQGTTHIECIIGHCSWPLDPRRWLQSDPKVHLWICTKKKSYHVRTKPVYNVRIMGGQKKKHTFCNDQGSPLIVCAKCVRVSQHLRMLKVYQILWMKSAS